MHYARQHGLLAACGEAGGGAGLRDAGDVARRAGYMIVEQLTTKKFKILNKTGRSCIALQQATGGSILNV